MYPAYINSRKTVKEGRVVPKDKAVDNPNYTEIRDVLSAAGLYIGIENKVYPRELDHRDQKCRGRIRIQLKNEDGTPAMKEFPTRRSVLLYLCDSIPKLKSRQLSQSQAQTTSQPQQNTKGQKKKGRKGKS